MLNDVVEKFYSIKYWIAFFAIKKTIFYNSYNPLNNPILIM